MKKFFSPLLFGLLFGLFVFSYGDVSAQLITPGDQPANIGVSTSFGGSLRQGILTIVNYVLLFLGILATVMVIYGGFLYVTAGGDDAGAEKGKKILTYAAIGIIVVLVSYALINTLIGSGLGVEPV
ncbi:pilin [Candidatus Gracilibacteria bacterium]|nr:pilin [Candidatus Gracilibacteria bacterium]